MYTRILVPLDGSKLAEVALPHAVTLAKQSKGTVVLLRVTQPVTAMVMPEAAYVDWDRIQAEIEAEARAYLADVSARLAAEGLAVQTQLKTADPAEAIIETAKTGGADLIVMATHGRSGLGRWVLGSVADRVVRAATAPVLLIRPAEMPGE
ncbi:MAG: universal stress protein [Chloroflexi bacterium]|nr:universal stress protein [Chloroflexota bacterium]